MAPVLAGESERCLSSVWSVGSNRGTEICAAVGSAFVLSRPLSINNPICYIARGCQVDAWGFSLFRHYSTEQQTAGSRSKFIHQSQTQGFQTSGLFLLVRSAPSDQGGGTFPLVCYCLLKSSLAGTCWHRHPPQLPPRVFSHLG